MTKAAAVSLRVAEETESVYIIYCGRWQYLLIRCDDDVLEPVTVSESKAEGRIYKLWSVELVRLCRC